MTGSDDGTARVWSTDEGEELYAVFAHEGYMVRSASFSSDGRRFVTASDESTARVWDADRGEELHALRGHEHLLLGASFSPDGHRVVTASHDRTARIWESLPPDLLVAKARTRAVRELTDAERAEYGLSASPRA